MLLQFRNIIINKSPLNIKLLDEFFIRFIYGHYHLWFLFTIVGLYIITPFLRNISSNKKLTEYFINLTFVFCYCINILKLVPVNFVTNLITTLTKIDINFVMGYSGYYLLGYYLHKYQLNKKYTKFIYIMAIISLSFTIIGSSLYSVKMGTPMQILYEYLLPNTFFVSIAVFLFFKI